MFQCLLSLYLLVYNTLYLFVTLYAALCHFACRSSLFLIKFCYLYKKKRDKLCCQRCLMDPIYIGMIHGADLSLFKSGTLEIWSFIFNYSACVLSPVVYA